MKPAEATTPNDTDVLVRRSFDASADLVWRAHTEPELVKQWMLGPPGWSMPVCEMDVRVGGKFRWRWRTDDGSQEFGFYGEYSEVVPLAKLAFSEYYDPGSIGGSMGEKPALITSTFTEENGVTLLTMLIRYATKEDRDMALSTGMTDGMEMSYQKLDGLLAQ